MDKIKLKSYSEKYNGIKKRKIFLIICIIILLSVIIGILYLAMLNKEGKEIVVNTVNTYFKDLNSSKAINNNLVNVLKNNIILTGIMWFLGVSLVGVIFEVLFLILKGFSLGFSISSFIYVFKFKGIYIGLVYLLHSIFNLLIYLILGFIAIYYSIYLYKYLFKNASINLSLLMKKYLKVLVLSLILLIISSVIEVFLIPNVLKLFTKTLF